MLAHHRSQRHLRAATIDEVHHLTAFTTGLAPDNEKQSAMYLRNVYRRVSSDRTFGKISPAAGSGPQGPAVHVSLSSDSPVKQPGNLAISSSRSAGKQSKPHGIRP